MYNHTAIEYICSQVLAYVPFHITDKYHVTDCSKRVIYSINFIKQDGFKKELSIHLIKFEFL